MKKKKELTDEENKRLRHKIKTDIDSLSVIEDEQEEEQSSKDKVLETLLTRKNINLKTELNDREILEIAKLEVVAERIDSDMISSFLSKFKELRISKDRQGRTEIIGASQDDFTKNRQGFFDQFVTGIGGNRGNL